MIYYKYNLSRLWFQVYREIYNAVKKLLNKRGKRRKTDEHVNAG